MRTQMDAELTHTMFVSSADTELSELRMLTARIRDSLAFVPPEQRRLIGDALLNLAVCFHLNDAGAQRTAGILIRLIDAVIECDTDSPVATPA